ncbi:nuclear transport factor 2 family protein [Asticcacaulis sp. DW145]|uniref:nuclear transport factor 2 family protein n=1 Tax=unclassified Asticcacaulis TaxID=2628350 RepID=UPI00261BF7B2|nr:nuclear transport factor 2 family protein [Asticcacaulis sp.]BEV11908.1 nuclear transport factor 2 family protein [Asticcacaulis sp. DW145]
MTTAIAIAAALLATPADLPSDPLTTEIRALDAKVFDAYNRCDLETFSAYFDPKVAFYHDTGGATFDRDAVVDGVRKYICGKVKRELITEGFHVYPIKDYGAIEEGEHRFCQMATGQCEGIAKFVMVWAKRDGAWQITSVLSYGHRAATAAEQTKAADR